MSFPISVIVPLQTKRRPFFERFCLPTIEINSPQEIIIIDEEGSAPSKRNKGAKLAKCPFLFFCDDDVCLGKDCLEKFHTAIKETSYGFTYSDFLWIDLVNNNSLHHIAKPFSKRDLLEKNYISTMSLLKTECFCGFRELPKYQDWDLWLTISSKFSGYYIPEILYISYIIDSGITKSFLPDEELKKQIRQRHFQFLG